MADSDQDKNLPASERKIRRAREDGQVARSRDLGHFAAVTSCGVALVAMAPWLVARLQHVVVDGLTLDAARLAQPDMMTDRLARTTVDLLTLMLPICSLLAAVAVVASLAIGGWNWTWKPLVPNFGKLNPITGLPRLLSKQQLMDTLKACALALVLGAVGALYARSHVGDFTGTLDLALPAALAHVGRTLQSAMLPLLLALALFAAIDVPLQLTSLAKRLRMNVSDRKQEAKEAEGNVEVKSKMRARMREMTKRRMLAAVPKADLVVMNPTHYAVALKYDEAKMAAPKVVAKGADLLALRIRDSARGAKVPVLESPMLARALYAHGELDREIPAALFAAVAQVLAYVYQLRAAMAGRGAMPGDLPAVNVPAELDPHNKPGWAPDADPEFAA